MRDLFSSGETNSGLVITSFHWDGKMEDEERGCFRSSVAERHFHVTVFVFILVS